MGNAKYRVSLAAVVLAALATLFACSRAPENSTGPEAPPKDPIVSAVRTRFDWQARTTIVSAQAPAAEKYREKSAYKRRTFGQAVAQIVASNASLCRSIGNQPPPDILTVKGDEGKDKLVAALRQSQDYCRDALQRVDDTKLADVVDGAAGKQTRAWAVVKLIADFDDSNLELESFLVPGLAQAAAVGGEQSAAKDLPSTNVKDPVLSAARPVIDRQARMLIAFAEKVPAEKYPFEPRDYGYMPEGRRSFGQRLALIAILDAQGCHNIGGQPVPADLPAVEGGTDIYVTTIKRLAAGGKERVSAALKESAEYCHDALLSTDDARLRDPAAKRVGALMALITNFAYNHYAMADYLRLSNMPAAAAGASPPSQH